MKKSILYSLLAVLTFFSCRKEDNPKLPDLIRAPIVLVNIDPSSDKFISPINPNGFKGVVNVDLLFANEKPKKVDLVVMKNGDPGNVKVLQADITTFPTKVQFTGQQLATLFGGQPITGGTTFTVGANITTLEGVELSAFLTGGAATYNSGNNTVVTNVKPGATTSVQYLMPCPYDPEMYKGDFVVVKDAWADTKPGDVITFTKIDATHFSFIYPTAVNPQPIIVTVDPATNTPSIALQTIGTAWTYDNTPPPPTAKTTTSPNNIVNPCNGTISLNMTWTEGPGSYPNLLFSLKKK